MPGKAALLLKNQSKSKAYSVCCNFPNVCISSFLVFVNNLQTCLLTAKTVAVPTQPNASMCSFSFKFSRNLIHSLSRFTKWFHFLMAHICFCVCVTAINNGSKKGNSLGVEIVETSHDYNMNMRWSVLSIICFQHWNVQWIYTTEFIILIWFLILLLQLRLLLRDGNCGCWERLQMWTKLQGLQLIMEEVTDLLHIYIYRK